MHLASWVQCNETVHLASWVQCNETLIDPVLLHDMETLIRVVELGRAARATAGVRVRQPLAEILVRVRNEAEMNGLKRLEDQLKEELNVKQVGYLDWTTDFVDYVVKPNLPLLGKRLGKQLPMLKQKLTTLDSREIVRNIRTQVETVLDLDGTSVHLEPEAFFIEVKSPDGYVAIEEQGYLAALNTQLTQQLIQEGLVRSCIRLLQEARKKAGLAISDRIQLGVQTSGILLDALGTHLETVRSEVLAEEICLYAIEAATYSEIVSIHGIEMQYWIKRSTVK